MDTIELRASADRLVNVHGRFAPVFGRQEPQAHSLGYLRALLLGTDCNSGGWKCGDRRVVGLLCAAPTLRDAEHERAGGLSDRPPHGIGAAS